MRLVVGSALISAGLVFVVMAGRGASQGPNGPVLPVSSYAPVQSGRGGELITHFAGSDGQPQVLTVIDPREQWIGVYHVDHRTGEISLKSARRITWDLQLIEFNSGKPLPQDIRSAQPR